MPFSSHSSAMRPRCSSMSGSEALPPMFTCTEIASAPSLMAWSTHDTSTFLFLSSPYFVPADMCMIVPHFGGLVSDFMMPLCKRTALAPPFSTSDTMRCVSTSPSIGPSLTPWSMGTMTALPDSRIRFIRIVLPSILIPSEHGRRYRIFDKRNTAKKGNVASCIPS